MDGKKIGASAGIFLILLLLSLQGLSMSSNLDLQEILTLLIGGINDVLIPFAFSVALLMFIYNVVKYFIIGINDVQGKESARRYALYSISGFVVLVSIWGIVNLLVGGIGLGGKDAACPDSVNTANCRNGSDLLGGYDF